MNNTKQKVLTAIALGVVFLIPNHFRFRHQRQENMNVSMFAFQWFGYVLSASFTWVDMGKQYLDHIEGE